MSNTRGDINRSPLKVLGSGESAGQGAENLKFCLGSATAVFYVLKQIIQFSWIQFSS